MIAILLAPVYLLANYYLLRRVMGWVKAWFPFFRTARHWALPVAVQAFLACSIVIAFFLPEGRARRVMKLIGNYWLGVLLYVLLAVIAADLLRLLLGYVILVQIKQCHPADLPLLCHTDCLLRQSISCICPILDFKENKRAFLIANYIDFSLSDSIVNRLNAHASFFQIYFCSLFVSCSFSSFVHRMSSPDTS